MKLRPATLPLVVATLAGGLMLTACGGSSSTDGASAGGSTSASASTDATGGAAGSTDSPSDAASTGSSASGSSSDSGSSSNASGTNASSGKKAAGSSTGGSAPQAAAGSGTAACRTADLSFSYGPGSGAQSVGSPGGVIIKMTNKGSASCSMTGYPGVNLVSSSVSWPLSRQTSVAPHRVTVKPGGSTSFTITYMPFTKGSGEQVDVTTLVITPPNETHSTRMVWDFQPVLRQDGATHPATYVGPVGGQ